MCACVCKYTKISVYMYYSVPMVVHSMLKKTHQVLGKGKVKLWVGGERMFYVPPFFFRSCCFHYIFVPPPLLVCPVFLALRVLH